MATTLTSFAVGLYLDAKDYIDESKLSRQETTQLQRVINSSRDPMDRYHRAMNTVAAAAKKGAMETEHAALMQQRLRDKFEKTTKMSDKFVASLKSMAAGYVGLAGLQKALSVVRDRMQEIDAIAKSARAIGENANELQRFQFAVGELAGVDSQQATTMLQKLNQRVGEASLGMGEAAKNFEALGLDIQELATMTPVQQFEALSEAISGIQNPAEQAAYATKFFEESGTRLLPVLTATKEQYEASAGQVERLGLAINDIDVANIEATNDAMNRLSSAVSGLGQAVAKIESLPFVIDAIAGAVSKLDEYGDFLSAFTKSGADIGANWMKGSEGVEEAAAVVEKAAQKQQSAVVDAAAEAEKAQKAANEQAELAAEQLKKQAELEKERQKQQEEAARQAERIAAEQERARESALDAARKHFEEERQRQMKMRQDIQSQFKSVEVGSSEDVRMRAEAMNRMTTAGMSDTSMPTDEQILSEAKKQYEETVKQTKLEQEQNKKLEAMLAELKNPKIKQFR